MVKAGDANLIPDIEAGCANARELMKDCRATRIQLKRHECRAPGDGEFHDFGGFRIAAPGASHTGALRKRKGRQAGSKNLWKGAYGHALN